MYVAIRTHVKNQKRLGLLQRTLGSCRATGIDNIGPVFVVDDGSPMAYEVEKLTKSFGYNYKPAVVQPGDTKNGLAESLNLEPGHICLACADDIVFGKDSLFLLASAVNQDIPALEARGIPWGFVSSFACYDRPIKFGDTSLWQYPLPLFYAAVCCLYSPQLQIDYVIHWNKIVAKELPYPEMCDDILLKVLCMEKGYINFNTLMDAVQHTGIDARSFGDQENAPSAYYTTKYFIGE